MYSKRKRPVAEIDILAIKNNKCDIYEVKCSYRITKAKQQLDKIRKHMRSQNKEVNNAFFFCAESGLLIEM